MASKAISGKPGGGKSYLAVKMILEELEHDTRPIVTNIPLNLAAIVDYFTQKGLDIAVYDRITELPWDETKNFWRYRGNGFIAPEIPAADFKAGARPDFTTWPDGGVFYALDELHEHLNSRAWADTGPLVLFYIAKHRHLGDDVTWITQSVANVDKQWRSVTQDYTYCRNWRKEKFRGFVKGNGFSATTYLEPFTGSQTEQETANYKLEPEIAACYATSLAGKAADVGKDAKGWNIKILYGAIIAGALLIMAFFVYGPNAITTMILNKKPLNEEKPATTDLPKETPPTQLPQEPIETDKADMQYYATIPITAVYERPMIEAIKQAGGAVTIDPESNMLYATATNPDQLLTLLSFATAAQRDTTKLPAVKGRTTISRQFFGFSGDIDGEGSVLIDDAYALAHGGYRIGQRTPRGVVRSATEFRVVFERADGTRLDIVPAPPAPRVNRAQLSNTPPAPASST